MDKTGIEVESKVEVTGKVVITRMKIKICYKKLYDWNEKHPEKKCFMTSDI